MFRTVYSFALALLFFLFSPAAKPAGDSKPLQIYFIDVEGGQSTLIVDPASESLLVDTGWAGFNGRDADRIEAAVKSAGLRQIDMRSSRTITATMSEAPRKSPAASRSPPSWTMVPTWRIPIALAVATPHIRKSPRRCESHRGKARRSASVQRHESADRRRGG